MWGSLSVAGSSDMTTGGEVFLYFVLPKFYTKLKYLVLYLKVPEDTEEPAVEESKEEEEAVEEVLSEDETWEDKEGIWQRMVRVSSAIGVPC